MLLAFVCVLVYICVCVCTLESRLHNYVPICAEKCFGFVVLCAFIKTQMSTTTTTTTTAIWKARATTNSKIVKVDKRKHTRRDTYLQHGGMRGMRGVLYTNTQGRFQLNCCCVAWFVGVRIFFRCELFNLTKKLVILTVNHSSKPLIL